MRLIRQATTQSVIVIDPNSPDPIVVANPGLSADAILRGAQPYLDRHRQLDLHQQLHGGMPTRWLYTLTFAAVIGVVGISVAITLVLMVGRRPPRPSVAAPPDTTIGQVAPGMPVSAPSTTTPATTDSAGDTSRTTVAAAMPPAPAPAGAPPTTSTAHHPVRRAVHQVGKTTGSAVSTANSTVDAVTGIVDATLGQAGDTAGTLLCRLVCPPDG